MAGFNLSGLLGGIGKGVGGFLSEHAGDLLSAGLNLYGAKKGSESVQRTGQQAAAMGQYRPQSIFTPFGNLVTEGNVTQFTPGDPFSQLPPELLAESASYADILGGQGDVFNQLGAGFLGSLGAFDPRQAATEQYDILTQMAEPGETRALNRLQDQLFARGQLGTTGGGIQQEALFKALGQTDLARQLAAREYAGKEQSRLAELGTGFAEAGAGRFGARYGLVGDLLQQNRAMFQPFAQLGQFALGAGAPNIAAQQLVESGMESKAADYGAYGEALQPVIGAIGGAIGGAIKKRFPGGGSVPGGQSGYGFVGSAGGY